VSLLTARNSVLELRYAEVEAAAEAKECVVKKFVVGSIGTANDLAVCVTIAVLLRCRGEGDSKKSRYRESSKL